MPPATRLFAGGSRKQETRDCKSPSSNRSEDLLPYPEVFWNLRLGCVSFLLSSFFTVPVSGTMGLPLLWVSLPSASSARSFTELGSCCAWPLLHRGWFSQVKSESWHHRCHVSVCSSVLCLITTKIWSDGH